MEIPILIKMTKLNLVIILLALSLFIPNLITNGNSELQLIIANDYIFINGDKNLSNFAISENLSGNGTITNPYIIQNNVIMGSFINGIHIQSTTSYLIIKNNTISNLNNGTGIFIDHCSNVVLENNNIQNSFLGIEIENSNTNIINNTILSSMHEGILVINSNSVKITGNYFNLNTNRAIHAQNSENLNIKNNVILNMNEMNDPGDYKPNAGILIDSSSIAIIKENIIAGSPITGISLWESCSNVLINSNILHNSQILLETVLSNITVSNNTLGATWGFIGLYSIGGAIVENNTIFETNFPIGMDYQSNFIVKNNYISNSGHGLFITRSDNNIVTGNTFANIDSEDIYIYTLDNLTPIGNKIFGNNFIDNKNQIYQDSLNNYWDNSTIGNYWGTYNGTDLNNDSIGDQSFTIPNRAYLSSSIYDNFPLMKPINQLNYSNRITYAKNLLKSYGNFSWTYSNGVSYTQHSNQQISSSKGVTVQTISYSTSSEISSSTVITLIIIIGLGAIIGALVMLSRSKSNIAKKFPPNKSVLTENTPTNLLSEDFQINNNICRRCHVVIEITDVFCYNCGNRL